MPTHHCKGDSVFVEGQGCRQGCPLSEITYVNSQELQWTCFQENGETYHSNSTHVLADHTCELVCPENSLPRPFESTVCQHDGSWRNRINLGCLKTCDPLETLNGTLHGFENASYSEQDLLHFWTDCNNMRTGNNLKLLLNMVSIHI